MFNEQAHQQGVTSREQRITCARAVCSSRWSLSSADERRQCSLRWCSFLQCLEDSPRTEPFIDQKVVSPSFILTEFPVPLLAGRQPSGVVQLRIPVGSASFGCEVEQIPLWVDGIGVAGILPRIGWQIKESLGKNLSMEPSSS